MSARRVVPREQAGRDTDQAIDQYLREAGPETALGFVSALEAGYRLIAEHPGIGSPRYAHELDLPGLRHRRLGRYPYLIFYIVHDNHIDVWRILDARSDLPAWLAEPDDSEGDARPDDGISPRTRS